MSVDRRENRYVERRRNGRLRTVQLGNAIEPLSALDLGRRWNGFRNPVALGRWGRFHGVSQFLGLGRRRRRGYGWGCDRRGQGGRRPIEQVEGGLGKGAGRIERGLFSDKVLRNFRDVERSGSLEVEGGEVFLKGRGIHGDEPFASKKKPQLGGVANRHREVRAVQFSVRNADDKDYFEFILQNPKPQAG